MNEFQTKLWNDLMALVNDSETFYYADRQMNDNYYRIFNYRLASYTEFLRPSGLECRGHMFQITEEGEDAEAMSLVSMPPAKFFNLNENPSTMSLDLTQVELIMDKMDGSLISTYSQVPWFSSQPATVLMLKTKGSLESDQAVAAMEWLALLENREFRDELATTDRIGYTVNLEWCAPDNRIVIGYMKPHLKVLSIRSREDGSHLDREDIDTFIFPKILEHWVYEYMFDDPISFIDAVPDSKEDIEGFVCRLKDGTYFKCKTLKYMALHHTKDSINTPRRLYETVLEDGTDDLRSMMYEDELAMKLIAEMETFVEGKYNHLVDTTERFYERNKHLERKDYAILGQQELDGKNFGLAMSKYLGKDVDYKEFMKKNWKYYGLKDEKVEVE